MRQPKRSHRRRKYAPDSDGSDDEGDAPSGAQIFSISNGGAAVLHRDCLFMLSEAPVGANEIQSENLTGFDEIIGDAPSVAQFFEMQTDNLNDASGVIDDAPFGAQLYGVQSENYKIPSTIVENAPSGAQCFPASSSSSFISRLDALLMLSEGSVGAHEVQDQVLHNSSGIRTSTRLQAKAWQEARVHQGAPESVQPSLQADGIRVQIPSEEDELDAAEDSEDAPELLPRPECKFGLKGAYAAHIFQPSAEEGASSDKEDASKVSKVASVTAP